MQRTTRSLQLIAEGKCAQKEIADFTHLAPTSLPPYLKDLTDLLGIIEYRVPVTEYDRHSKMGRYIFSDNFFRFYARYIYRNMSLYQSGQYSLLKEKILSEWKGFFRPVHLKKWCARSLKRTLPAGTGISAPGGTGVETRSIFSVLARLAISR